MNYLRQSLRIADGEEPVLHDHLGDAFYRKGDQAAAESEWKKALKMCDPKHDPPPDRDRRILYESLSKKLNALEKSLDVETAPIGGATSQPAMSLHSDR
ncbi:MAG: hypothetical protein IPK83_12815 [Planctomycetes bacterium]|nr:hypothetical protein [Planctomycetota bacterium]